MRDPFDKQHQREQLHRAAGDGDLPRVERLIAASYPVNRFDEVGRTPLHCAVEGEHMDIVRRLLGAKANVNAHDERVCGDTPLTAVAETCSFEMAELLINAGADPTIPGFMRTTALDRAERRKSTTDGRPIYDLLRQAAKRIAKLR